MAGAAKPTHRLFWLVLGGLGVVLLAIPSFLLWQLAAVGTGYAAKTLCSGVFISKRDPADILSQDIGSNDPGILRFIRTQVDRPQRAVRATFLGLRERQAVFRDGLGCTLAAGVPAAALRAVHAGLPVPTGRDDPWPEGEAVANPLPSGVDGARLAAALEEAFAEPDPSRLRRTRAVVVVYDDRIVAERYAIGYSKDTPLGGWSMTKNVANALVGILVREGRLALEAPAPVPEWQAPDDPRRAITLGHLLRMESGLKFSENYTDPLDDVVWMLFGTGDASGYAAAKPLAAAPGETWKYTSGTTNIIARAMRTVFNSDAEYLAYPRRALFEPLGMKSAIMEADAAGNFVASSFMYATARDWARFGLLYLNDGVWQGRRILPEGWVDYSVMPAPHAPDGRYGAHFWLGIPAPFADAEDKAALPRDAFHAIGHEGQFMTVIPSRRLVVVRLGLAVGPGVWDHERFLQQVLRAFPARP